MKEIISNVNWLVFDSGIEQKEIAKRTNLGTSTISRINRGQLRVKNMKFEHVMKLNDYAKEVKK